MIRPLSFLHFWHWLRERYNEMNLKLANSILLSLLGGEIGNLTNIKYFLYLDFDFFV